MLAQIGVQKQSVLLTELPDGVIKSSYAESLGISALPVK